MQSARHVMSIQGYVSLYWSPEALGRSSRADALIFRNLLDWEWFFSGLLGVREWSLSLNTRLIVYCGGCPFPRYTLDKNPVHYFRQ